MADHNVLTVPEIKRYISKVKRLSDDEDGDVIVENDEIELDKEFTRMAKLIPTHVKNADPIMEKRKYLMFKMNFLGMILDGAATEKNSTLPLERELFKEFNGFPRNQLKEIIRSIQMQLSKLKI